MTGVLVVIACIASSLQGGTPPTATGSRIQATAAALPNTQVPSTDEITAYTVPADAPRLIIIPRIDTRARVMALGLDVAGRIDAPHNVHDAGWFNQSSKPGRPGAIVIDGHVSGWASKGVFYNLNKLSPGDPIIIERGDTSRVTYHVAKSQGYEADKVDMTALLAPIDPEHPGLNIITCTGAVLKGTNEYDKRLIVFASAD